MNTNFHTITVTQKNILVNIKIRAHINKKPSERRVFDIKRD